MNTLGKESDLPDLSLPDGRRHVPRRVNQFFVSRSTPFGWLRAETMRAVTERVQPVQLTDFFDQWVM
jgi:hypothetical protein